MKTRVISLDVYGTMLPTKGKSVTRRGLITLLSRCKKSGLILCTCSDGQTQDVKKDLLDAEIDLRYFNKYFEMPRKGKNFINEPKDFKPILNYYNLYPNELTIIGDREKRDITPAIELKCNAILVPEYRTERDQNNFDLNNIVIP